MRLEHVSIILVIAVSFLYDTNASLEEADMFRKLFDSKTYNKNIFPPTPNGTALELKMGIALMSLSEINVKEGYLAASIWLRLKWADERLKLIEPNAKENITVLRVPVSSIWTPSITLANPYGGPMKLGSSNTLVYPNTAQVLWVPHAEVKASCVIDAYYFPFDEQTCSFKMQDSVYMADELDLTVYANRYYVDMSDYWKSPKWEFVSTHALKNTFTPQDTKVDQATQDLTFSVTFRRRLGTHFQTLIVPTLLTSFLFLLVFLLPTDSPEKLALNFVSIIALILMLINLGRVVPPSGVSMPLFTRYTLFVLVLNILALLVTTLLLYVTSKDTPLPEWVQSGVIGKLGKIVRIVKKDATGSSSAPEKANGENHVQELPNENDLPISDAENTILSTLNKRKIQNEKNESWKTVAAILNRALFLLFVAVLLLGFIVYLSCVKMPGSTDDEDKALRMAIGS